MGGVGWGDEAVVVEFEKPAVAVTESSEGVVALAWKADLDEVGQSFEVEQEFSGERTIRYSGEDLGTVLTGLPEGDFRFRVRGLEPVGDWSEPVMVKVKFMERGKVFLLMGLGFVVFFATIGTLLAGHFRTASE